MWHITITGHVPDNPTRVVTLTIRGESRRTLATRVRVAAGWKGSAMMKQVDDTHVEFHPSKRSGDAGHAFCEWVEGDAPKVLTPEEHTQKLLQCVDLRDLTTALVTRCVDPALLAATLPLDVLAAEVKHRLATKGEV